MILRDRQPALPWRTDGRMKMDRLPADGPDFFDEPLFGSMLDLERKRCRRSGRALILVLVNMTGTAKTATAGVPDRLAGALARRIRETDLLGWYLRDAVIGILFTDILSAGSRTREALFGKVLDALSAALEPGDLRQVYATFHTFPADLGDAVPCGRFDTGRISDRPMTGARAHGGYPGRIFEIFGMKSCR